jgi:hypothetical protein
MVRGSRILDCYAGGIISHAEPFCVRVAWRSTDAGAVNMNIASTLAAAMTGQAPKPSKLRGYLTRVVTIPGTSSDAPTDNYDLYLKDPNGIDIALGLLVDRDQTNSEQYVPATPTWVDHEINLVIANAGNALAGTVDLYFTP